MARFNAFISYSQGADKRIAEAIQTGLQALGAKKHLLKFRALQIFRDETSMSGHISLKEKIEYGLDNSEFLVVVASPYITKPSGNAQINWIEEEIKYWLSTKHKAEFDTHGKIRHAKVIICHVDGEISWDHKTNDFNWTKTNCLPDVFKNRFAAEPHYVSFKKIVDDQKNSPAIDRLTLSFPDFKKKIAELSSIIQGRSVDELIAKDRKAQTMWTSLLAVVSIILACLAASLWFVSEQSRRNEMSAIKSQEDAKKSEANAKANARIADENARQAEENKVRAMKTADSLDTSNKKLKASEHHLRIANDTILSAKASLANSYDILLKKNDTIQRESAERKRNATKVSLINNILAAENLALNAIAEPSPIAKRDSSLKAYDTLQLSRKELLHEYLGSDKHLYEKTPTIYNALKEAYASNNPVIRTGAGLKVVNALPDRIIMATLDGKIRIVFPSGPSYDLQYESPPNTFILKIFLTHDPAYLLLAMSDNKMAVAKIDAIHRTVKNVHQFTAAGLIKSIHTTPRLTLMVSEGGEVYRVTNLTTSPPTIQHIASLHNIRLAQVLTDTMILTYDNQGHYSTVNVNGTRLTTGKHPFNIKAMAYDHASDAMFYYDGIKIYKTSISAGSGKVVEDINITGAKSLLLTHDKSKLIVNTDNSLYIIDLIDKKEKHKHYTFTSNIRHVTLDEKDVIFVALDNGEVRYWPIHFSQIYQALKVAQRQEQSATARKP